MNTRRYSLFVLLAGIATFASLILMIAMSGGEIARPAEYPNREGFTQAIFWFEMIRSPEEVRSVLGDPAAPSGMALRHAMDMTNTYDYIFMVCYPLLFAALFLFLGRRLSDTGRMPPYGAILVRAGLCVALLIFCADAYENLQLFKLSAYTDLSKIDPAIITKLMISTQMKSWAIAAAGLFLIYLYTAYFMKSWGLILPAIYAVSFVLGVAALTVSGRRALIETSASVSMTGWLISVIHGGCWFFKKRS